MLLRIEKYKSICPVKRKKKIRVWVVNIFVKYIYIPNSYLSLIDKEMALLFLNSMTNLSIQSLI